MIQQAGAVTFRGDANNPEFLIVRAKKNPDHWIFPKGHIEPGESADAAAVRELREEAGVSGEAVEPLGSLLFQSPVGTVQVQYYLCRCQDQVGEGDGRERQWCDQDRALQLLTFEDTQELLRRAADKLSLKGTR